MPIGRKEIAKFNSKVESSGGEGGRGKRGVVEKEGGEEEEEEEGRQSNISRGFCTVWNYVTTFTRDLLVGPPTDLHNCLNAFFDASELKGNIVLLYVCVCMHVCVCLYPCVCLSVCMCVRVCT